MMERIRLFTEAVKEWNKSSFGNIFARKRRRIARLKGIQRALESGHKNAFKKLEMKLRSELEEETERKM